MEKMQQISIWFFIGSLLCIYGILILATGIIHCISPPAKQMALSHLHSDVWWGALLLIIGFIYTIKFWPWKRVSGK
jgi:hypothetical protein